MAEYYSPQWMKLHNKPAIALFKGGIKEEGGLSTEEDYYIVIPSNHIPSLVAFLNENGYIKQYITPENRNEDIKIIHRLLDLAEKKIK